MSKPDQMQETVLVDGNWHATADDDGRELTNSDHAYRARLKLAHAAQCLTTAIDTAESIQADNTIEHMLAHQMAAAHRLAMKFAEKSQELLLFVETWDSKERQQVQSIEAVRLCNASARMMSAFNDGAKTLDKLRRGGEQQLTVQHVSVKEGGQAVVAGQLKTGGDREK